MRYSGGGVGYTYMWAIEQWLWTTGWGCGIPDIDVSEPQSDDGDKVFGAGEMAEDFEDGGVAEVFEDEEMAEVFER